MNALQIAGVQVEQMLRPEVGLLASGPDHDFIAVESAGVTGKVSKQREHLNILTVNGGTVAVPRMLLCPDIAEWVSADLSRVACKTPTYILADLDQSAQRVKRQGKEKAKKIYGGSGVKTYLHVGQGALRQWVPAIVAPAELQTPRIIEDVLGLASDWDGEGSVAPSPQAKRAVIEISAYLRSYISGAEVEVDPSDGGVAFRWFRDDDKSLVSVDVRPSGRVIVVGTTRDGESKRKALVPQELQRVLRTVIDAGLTHIHARLR